LTSDIRAEVRRSFERRADDLERAIGPADAVEELHGFVDHDDVDRGLLETRLEDLLGSLALPVLLGERRANHAEPRRLGQSEPRLVEVLGGGGDGLARLLDPLETEQRHRAHHQAVTALRIESEGRVGIRQCAGIVLTTLRARVRAIQQRLAVAGLALDQGIEHADRHVPVGGGDGHAGELHRRPVLPGGVLHGAAERPDRLCGETRRRQGHAVQVEGFTVVRIRLEQSTERFDRLGGTSLRLHVADLDPRIFGRARRRHEQRQGDEKYGNAMASRARWTSREKNGPLHGGGR
jgi:hypothetical protein